MLLLCWSPAWGILWAVSFPCNRKMVVSAAWEKAPSLLSDKTLRMKLQEEVDGRETVNDPRLQLLMWITDFCELMHSANHFLAMKLHKSLGPKPLMVAECEFFLQGTICLIPCGPAKIVGRWWRIQGFRILAISLVH